MKHTPGPWGFRKEDEVRPTSTFVVESNEWQICFTESDAGEPDAEEANARLIAAAPDLLAACIALQMEAASRGCGLRIADEAIARATGAAQ